MIELSFSRSSAAFESELQGAYTQEIQRVCSPKKTPALQTWEVCIPVVALSLCHASLGERGSLDLSLTSVFDKQKWAGGVREGGGGRTITINSDRARLRKAPALAL